LGILHVRSMSDDVRIKIRVNLVFIFIVMMYRSFDLISLFSLYSNPYI